MTCRAFFVISIAAMAVLATTQAASAQSPRGRYSSPSGPTLTPHLDYFRRDNGVLNPYFNFVRPKFQAYDELRQLESRLQQQDLRQAELRQDLQAVRETPAAVTGTGATYMNYSHFYPTARQARPRR